MFIMAINKSTYIEKRLVETHCIQDLFALANLKKDIQYLETPLLKFRKYHLQDTLLFCKTLKFPFFLVKQNFVSNPFFGIFWTVQFFSCNRWFK
jgi:hypothetical protein